MVVTFFGHKDAPDALYATLLETIIDLTETQDARIFYVGNEGRFDYMVRKILKKLSAEYPHIRYTVVLAYFPWKQDDLYPEDFSDTIFPEQLAKVPKKYAIDKRNRLMLARADTVVTYVWRTDGGAAKFQALAEKQGKKVINLAEPMR